MNIQTPTPRIEVTHDDVIGALTSRSAALMCTSASIYALKGAPADAARGDLEAERRVRDAIHAVLPRLSLHDIDIIDRLREQLHRLDFFELCAIATEAKQRSYSVDIKIDRLNRLHDAEKRRAEAYREKRADRKLVYTVAYEAAEKLNPLQRRQLAEAILS